MDQQAASGLGVALRRLRLGDRAGVVVGALRLLVVVLSAANTNLR